MIRRGKKEGWLNLSAAQIPDWASMNNVQLHSVSIEASGDSQKGSSLVAKKSGTGSALNPLMTIPPNVVLCKETVYLHAKSDRVLKEVLDAIGEFGQVEQSNKILHTFQHSYVTDSPWCYLGISPASSYL